MRLSVIFRDPIQPIRSQERVLKLKQSEQRVLPVRVGTLLSRQCQQLLEGNQADAIHSKREKGPHLRANFFTSHPLWKGGGDHTDWAKLKSQEWGKKKNNNDNVEDDPKRVDAGCFFLISKLGNGDESCGQSRRNK